MWFPTALLPSQGVQWTAIDDATALATLTGPEVHGTWTWSHTRTRVEFHPDAPFRHQLRYTLHVGGAVQDARGRHLNYEQCIDMHSAQWAWEQMRGGHHPGTGWKHQTGSYGMFLWFETG